MRRHYEKEMQEQKLFIGHFRYSTIELKTTLRYLERFLEKFDFGGPLKLVTTVSGNHELDPIAMLQSEVSNLIFLAERNFNL